MSSDKILERAVVEIPFETWRLQLRLALKRGIDVMVEKIEEDPYRDLATSQQLAYEKVQLLIQTPPAIHKFTGTVFGHQN